MVYAPRVTTTFFLGLLLNSLLHSDATRTPSASAALAVFFAIVLVGGVFQALFGLMRLGTNRRFNPMLLDMHQALRCRARSKRSGKRCRSPAVRGHSVCRMHGAGGGAPRGNSNALKHGDFTAEAIAEKREIQALSRMAKETLAALE